MISTPTNAHLSIICFLLAVEGQSDAAIDPDSMHTVTIQSQEVAVEFLIADATYRQTRLVRAGENDDFFGVFRERRLEFLLLFVPEDPSVKTNRYVVSIGKRSIVRKDDEQIVA
jgi:hypothetical protein